MTEPDEARAEDVLTSTQQRRSRFFWIATALAIATLLLLCAALILIASTRS